MPAPTNGPAWGRGTARLGGLHGTACSGDSRQYCGARAGLSWCRIKSRDSAGEDVARAGARSLFWLCLPDSEHTEHDRRGSQVLQNLTSELASTLSCCLLPNYMRAHISSTLPNVAQFSIFIISCVLMERQKWATRRNTSRALCFARGVGKLSQKLILSISSSGTYRGGNLPVWEMF